MSKITRIDIFKKILEIILKIVKEDHVEEQNIDNSTCNCVNHSRQSPIDILNNNMNLGKTPLLKVNYNKIKLHKYSNAEKYKPYEEYFLFFNNYKFKLINVHFHKQSEHKLNGKQYDMEAHFVHKAIDANEYVVFGFFINIVDQNKSDKILDDLVALQENVTITLPNLEDNTFFNYKGSLTTPSFNSDVEWCVFQTPLNVYISQENRDKHGSARPIQTTVYKSEILKFTY